MRCLIASDLHYSLPQYDWVLKQAGAFDVVILAGDQLDVSSIVDYRAQILVVRKYVERLVAATRLIVCSGNHDLDKRGPGDEKIARWIGDLSALGPACDGACLMLDGVVFSVYPWWDGPAVREKLIAQLACDAETVRAAPAGTRWIWVHHAPPKDSPVSLAGQRSQGDADLCGWIEEYGPDIVLSGHIHQAPFVNGGSWADRVGRTWVFNAGHQFGAPPAYIMLDLANDEAVWISAMGAQSVKLDAPLARPIPPLAALPAWAEAIQISP